MKIEETMYLKYNKGSFFNLIPTRLRQRTLHERIRWLMQLPYGYIVCNAFVGGEEIGYVFLGKGGNPRYPFASKNDLVVGPYYIRPEYRGHHYASTLLEKCLFEKHDFCKAYAFIDKSNKASIKTAESAGFYYAYNAKYSKYFRVLKKCEEESAGSMQIYIKRGENGS